MNKFIISGQIRKILLAIFGMILIASSSYLFYKDVSAQGQDTCPDGGDWVKVDGINAQSYEYTAPEGKQIVETCYKAGTTLRYNIIDSPQTTITLISDVLNPEENACQDISHASFRLEDITPTPTPTFTSTPTEEVTPTPTFTPTPTDVVTPTPTSTTPPTDETFLELMLLGECLESGSHRWQVSNNNPYSVQFSWQSSTGESGIEEVAANDLAYFVTPGNATTVRINYSLENKSLSASAEVELCQLEDPKPDETAGGSGPTILSALPYILIGLSGSGLIAVMAIKPKSILNKNK